MRKRPKITALVTGVALVATSSVFSPAVALEEFFAAIDQCTSVREESSTVCAEQVAGSG